MPKKKSKIPSHVGLAGKLKSKRDYTNYVSSGGTSDFETWKKENK